MESFSETSSDNEFEPVTKNFGVVVADELEVLAVASTSSSSSRSSSPVPSAPLLLAAVKSRISVNSGTVSSNPAAAIVNGVNSTGNNVDDKHTIPAATTLQTQPPQTQQVTPQQQQVIVNSNAPIVQNGQHPPLSAPRIVSPSERSKANALLRKMSVMVEEESSDDLDNDCPNSARSIASSHADNDSDSTYEERGRLLSADSSSASPIARPAAALPLSSTCSRSSSRRGSPVVKLSANSSRCNSADSFHEKQQQQPQIHGKPPQQQQRATSVTRQWPPAELRNKPLREE